MNLPSSDTITTMTLIVNMKYLAIGGMSAFIPAGNDVENRKVFEKINEDKIMETKSMKILEIDQDEQMSLFFQTKKRKILPRSQNQKKYFRLSNQ